MKHFFKIIALSSLLVASLLPAGSVFAGETRSFFDDLTDPTLPTVDPNSILSNEPFQRESQTTANPFNTQLQTGTKEFGLGEFQPKAGEYVHPVLFFLRWVTVGFTLLGIGTIAGIIYGGVLWMTSQGESEQVEKAKRTLRNGFIGLVIILMSYSIVFFVGRSIQNSAGSFGTRGFSFGGEFNQFVE